MGRYFYIIMCGTYGAGSYRRSPVSPDTVKQMQALSEPTSQHKLQFQGTLKWENAVNALQQIKTS